MSEFPKPSTIPCPRCGVLLTAVDGFNRECSICTEPIDDELDERLRLDLGAAPRMGPT